MRLVHKLKELVDNRFEKLPMRFEEPRVLANNVHDIRRADGLVVLAALHLCKTKQVFDDCDKESFLRLLICGRLR